MQLLEHKVVLEEFGGDVPFTGVSAKTAEGLARMPLPRRPPRTHAHAAGTLRARPASLPSVTRHLSARTTCLRKLACQLRFSNSGPTRTGYLLALSSRRARRMGKEPWPPCWYRKVQSIKPVPRHIHNTQSTCEYEYG